MHRFFPFFSIEANKAAIKIRTVRMKNVGVITQLFDEQLLAGGAEVPLSALVITWHDVFFFDPQ